MFRKDPVCGTRVEVARAVATEIFAGVTFYFCSHACHERFLAEPERYAYRHTGPE